MTSKLRPVSAALAKFMDGGSYWGLYRAVVEAAGTMDSSANATNPDLVWFDQLYELVYMGTGGAVSEHERETGRMNADELREKIREARLLDSAPPPA
jgi:hypothetical protein